MFIITCKIEMQRQGDVLAKRFLRVESHFTFHELAIFKNQFFKNAFSYSLYREAKIVSNP